MKFMKLGSKPDSFQSDGENIRYVATELATDVVIHIRDVKFYLHKFPLLSKSACLQKLVGASDEESSDEIYVHDIPGGAAAFEICAKFCYGMTVTLNAYNVVAARCAAEYLEMYEPVEKGNLVYKIDVFLNSSIFRSWKDSIIVLQTTQSLLPWSEELKLVSHCLDSIASRASIDSHKVEWSYTYNRKKLPSENGSDSHWNGVRKKQMVPNDWWVEDLCELQLDLYKRVITTIKTKGNVSGAVIGEALNAYTLRRLPGFINGMIQSGDVVKHRLLVETILQLLPAEKGTVSCNFLLKLLKAAMLLDCGESERRELIKRIGKLLDEAMVADLLMRVSDGETMMFDVNTVHRLVEEFVSYNQSSEKDSYLENEFQEIRSCRLASNTPMVKVAKLIDGYLAEISRDPNLTVTEFLSLAESISIVSRPSHDRLYRAIDMYLKEHPCIGKSEKKRICKLMDCRKLSADACAHAIQNERLPLRVVVQVLFFEQQRNSPSSAGNSSNDLPGSIGILLPGGSLGSSRSTTTNNEDWDSVTTAEKMKVLKGELATLKLVNRNGVKHGRDRNSHNGNKSNDHKVAADTMKNLVMSKKVFSKLWSNKERNGDLSSSDTSDSPASTSGEETKSTPSRSRRNSVS